MYYIDQAPACGRRRLRAAPCGRRPRPRAAPNLAEPELRVLGSPKLLQMTPSTASRRRRPHVTVADHFNLHRGQASLDFVNVNLRGDTRVFVDPHSIRVLPGQWTEWCVSLLQSYFRSLLAAIKASDQTEASRLLAGLREPNETRLGMSIGRPRGSGIGQGLARQIYRAFATSAASTTGLLEDLEDTILLIDGIDRDRISDITTNVIREPLIEYTQRVARQYEIPLTEGVPSGHAWNAETSRWEQDFVALPRTPYGKVLLVPKAIVRRDPLYDASEYEHDFIIPYLRDVELDARSSLVQILKNGRLRVTKKDLRAKYGSGKDLNRRITEEKPTLLARYRTAKRSVTVRPMSQEDLAEALDQPPPDWDGLISRLIEVPRGSDGATAYHRAIEDLLNALFHPALIFPVREAEIHEGRKRIDIRYTNAARAGFFWWLGTHYPCAHVAVECKNYTGDPENPELDQLAGRFSPSRGQFGILACRNFSSLSAKRLFIERCRDTARDGRGWIIPVDDDDLRELCKLRKARGDQGIFEALHTRFLQLID